VGREIVWAGEYVRRGMSTLAVPTLALAGCGHGIARRALLHADVPLGSRLSVRPCSCVLPRKDGDRRLGRFVNHGGLMRGGASVRISGVYVRTAGGGDADRVRSNDGVQSVRRAAWSATRCWLSTADYTTESYSGSGAVLWTGPVPSASGGLETVGSGGRRPLTTAD